MSERTQVAFPTFASLKGVGRVAQISIGCSVALSVVDSLFRIAADELKTGNLQNLGALLSIIGNLAVIIAIPVTLMAFSYLVVWLRRAINNLPGLNVPSANIKPWYAFSFFIPLVNLFMPQIVMQIVWKASDPEYLDETSWRSAPGSPLIWGYWITTMAQIVLLIAGSVFNWNALLPFEGLMVTTYTLLIFFIGNLAARQEKKRNQLARPEGTFIENTLN